MTIRSLAEEAASKASAALSSPVSQPERETITHVIEEAITAAVMQTMQECRDAAVRCADQDQLKKKMIIEINKSATARFPDMGSTR